MGFDGEVQLDFVEGVTAWLSDLCSIGYGFSSELLWSIYSLAQWWSLFYRTGILKSMFMETGEAALRKRSQKRVLFTNNK